MNMRFAYIVFDKMPQWKSYLTIVIFLILLALKCQNLWINMLLDDFYLYDIICTWTLGCGDKLVCDYDIWHWELWWALMVICVWALHVHGWHWHELEMMNWTWNEKHRVTSICMWLWHRHCMIWYRGLVWVRIIAFA